MICHKASREELKTTAITRGENKKSQEKMTTIAHFENVNNHFHKTTKPTSRAMGETVNHSKIKRPTTYCKTNKHTA